MNIGFDLAPGIDRGVLADEYRRLGRVRIQPFLTDESADALIDYLTASEDWKLVLNAGDNVYEIDRPGQRELSGEKRQELDRRIAQSAAREFQFRYESIRVPDESEQRDERGWPIDRLASFLSSPTVVDLFREITGADDIDFADAQATLFSPGDFLTVHNDDVDGKNRRAAYVLGLSREWRTDWGGLLTFHAPDGDLKEAWLPRFNALNLFAVPQPHSVSVVAPFAPEKRYSVTGWLRAAD